MSKSSDLDLSPEEWEQLGKLAEYWRIWQMGDSREALEILVQKGLVEKRKQRRGFAAMYRWTEHGKALAANQA